MVQGQHTSSGPTSANEKRTATSGTVRKKVLKFSIKGLEKPQFFSTRNLSPGQKLPIHDHIWNFSRLMDN
jgi:hypothetical protein